MGESKRRKYPRGRGPEFETVVVHLPATFHYNPRTGEVFYPRPGKSAQKVTDPNVTSAVEEVYSENKSEIIKP